MGLNNKNLPQTGGNNTPAEPMEAGNYPCRVVQVIDLGLQPQRAWEGQEKPPIQTLMVTYEFTDEFLKDEEGNDRLDKPRWLSEDFPHHKLSSERATSTKRYNALDPTGTVEGDWALLVGAPCMVTVVTSEGKGKNVGRTFNNIGGVATMRSRDVESTPKLVNEPKILNLDEPDLEIFKSLPDWLQDKIKANLEFKGSALDQLLSGSPAPADDVPVEAATQTDDTTTDVPW